MFEKATGKSPWDLADKDVDEFKAGIDPLASAGKLGALLAQFPASFQNDDESRAYLEWLLKHFREYPGRARTPPSQLERSARRHAAAARRIRSGVDPDRRTEVHGSPSARICSRTFAPSTTCASTAATRRSGGTTNNQRTATTTCTPPAELKPIAQAARQASREVKKAYLYANNHFSAKSVANAAILKHDLGQPLPGEYPPEFVDRYPDLKGLVRILPPPPSRKPS